MNGLEQLLHPLPVSAFLDALEKAPLVVANRCAEDFRGLLDRSALEAILARFGPAPKHAVRLSKAGGDPGTIWFEDEAPSLARIRAALEDGYTLNVNDLADRHPPIRALSAQLCAGLGATIRVNAFLTPAGGRAFPLHFDPHEVLVLQLEGEKRWRVFSAPIEAPTPQTVATRTIDPGEAGPPLVDRVLLAGDLLVIPRGFGHEAFCGDVHSLHLTIAVHLPTWADVLTRLVAEAENAAPALRRSVPVGAIFGGGVDQVRSGLAEALATLDGGIEAALCSLGVDTLAEHPAVPGPPLLAGELPPITVDRLLSRRTDSFGLVYQRGSRVGVQWPGMRVECPLKARPALEYIRDRTEAFTVGQLPGLSDGERIQLARRLLLEGVLALAEAGVVS